MKLLYVWAGQKVLWVLMVTASLGVFTGLAKNTHHKDYKKIACDLTAIKSPGRHRSHPHIPLSVKVVIPGTSTNWSGYVAVNSPKSVSAVSASWIIPKLTKKKEESCCAAWVGMDGYNNSMVEQIGTMQDLVNGEVQLYAWFEMYPAGSYKINGFPVNPGDVVTASVTYSGANTFTLTISNVTKKVTYEVPASHTKTSTAPRCSAEWVVEAPYDYGILPLADFGSMCFSNCKATINGESHLLGSSPWTSTALTMVNDSATIKAVPSAVGDKGAFSVTWKHQ